MTYKIENQIIKEGFKYIAGGLAILGLVGCAGKAPVGLYENLNHNVVYQTRVGRAHNKATEQLSKRSSLEQITAQTAKNLKNEELNDNLAAGAGVVTDAAIAIGLYKLLENMSSDANCKCIGGKCEPSPEVITGGARGGFSDGAVGRLHN